MKLSTIESDTEWGRYHRPDVTPDMTSDGTEAKSFPSLVLIHDVWGLSQHSHDLAADLASEGFGVLEINLYREMAEVTIDAPGPFIQSLSDSAVLADLDAGAEWMATTGGGTESKIGVVGVCMGGTYALLAACLSNRFAAAAPFYGILSYEHGMLANPDGRDRERKPLSPLEAASKLKMPLLASFGAEDDFVPVADVSELEGRFDETEFPVQVDVYPGAGHAFLNRTREAAYRSEASSLAWAKLIPFLHAHLD